MIFGVLNPKKIWHHQLVHLPTSPVYCSHFTLGNPKKSFSTVLFKHTSDYLRYLRRKLLYPPHLKNVTTLPCKMHNFFIWLKVCCIPPKLVALKKQVVGWQWWFGKRTFCDVWQMECHALQQMFKVTIFCTDTCFQSFSPLFNCIVHHALLKFSPCRNASATRPYRGLLLNMRKKWKKWKICAFYKVVRWHFSGVVGKGVTVCCFLR